MFGKEIKFYEDDSKVVPAEYRNSYEKNLDMVIIPSYLFSYVF